MKWAAVFILLVSASLGGLAIRGRPRLQFLAALLIGFSPFLNLHLNPISFELYRGDSRGLEFTLCDFSALTLWMSLPRGDYRPAYRWTAGFYLLAAVCSSFHAEVPLYSIVGVWKIARLWFICATVTRAAMTLELNYALLTGLGSGIVYGTLVALKQRYWDHYYQCRGPFEHQNSFGMVADLIFPTALALILARRGRTLATAVVLGSAISVILSLSRGTLVMFALAAGLVFLGSLLQGLTPFKTRVSLLALLVASALAIKAGPTIVARFSSAPTESEAGRIRFSQAAAEMLRDHPWGVGVNSYSLTLDTKGYADALGIGPGDRDGLAHNVYWLTAAEMGYFGFFCLVALFALPLWRAARGAYRHRGTVRGDLLLGLSASLFVTYAHFTLEWSFRITPVAQVLWINWALIACLSSERTRWPMLVEGQPKPVAAPAG